MARPSVNNAEYFTHHANLRNDRRIRAIRSELGATGYGVLIMLLEVLTEADFTELNTDPIEVKLLAGDLGVSVTEIDSLLQLAEEIGYFGRNSNGNLICPDLNRWLEPVFEKRSRARQTAQGSRKPVPETEKPISVTETPQSREEKSKVEKSKGKKDSSAAAAALDESPSEKKPTITHKLRQVVESINPDYYWAAKDGTAAKELAEKLRHSFRATKQREPTDEDICESLRRLIGESRKLPMAFYHFKDVCALNQQYNAILLEIKSPTARAPAPSVRSDKANQPVTDAIPD